MVFESVCPDTSKRSDAVVHGSRAGCRRCGFASVGQCTYPSLGKFLLRRVSALFLGLSLSEVRAWCIMVRLVFLCPLRHHLSVQTKVHREHRDVWSVCSSKLLPISCRDEDAGTVKVLVALTGQLADSASRVGWLKEFWLKRL